VYKTAGKRGTWFGTKPWARSKFEGKPDVATEKGWERQNAEFNIPDSGSTGICHNLPKLSTQKGGLSSSPVGGGGDRGATGREAASGPRRTAEGD